MQFTLAIWIIMLICIINVSGLILKVFIFNKQSSKEEKFIHIWWLCCSLGKKKDYQQEEKLN